MAFLGSSGRPALSLGIDYVLATQLCLRKRPFSTSHQTALLNPGEKCGLELDRVGTPHFHRGEGVVSCAVVPREAVGCRRRKDPQVSRAVICAAYRAGAGRPELQKKEPSTRPAEPSGTTNRAPLAPDDDPGRIVSRCRTAPNGAWDRPG